jgi:putative Holliday junction resolvase
VTDELQLIASGLTTVQTHGLMPFLSTYFSEQKVETIIIGEPTQKDGAPSSIEGNIQNFIKGFSLKFPNIAIVRVDERFTSKMAFQTMIDSGLKKKQRQNKALVDEISATINLQQFLYTK